MKKIIYTFCITFLCSIQIAVAQNVSIPDATFKAILVGDPNINTNNDGEIQLSEAQAYKGTIGAGLGVSDVTGIEAFTNITGFDCEMNNVSSVDLSNNTKLGFIRIYGCPITSLDISGNKLAIDFFYCFQCPLTSLKVPDNATFTYFLCQQTQLTTLDFSKNITFGFFNCGLNSQLTSLNIKNGHNAELTNFYANNNPNLTCIQVDDPAYMDAHWSSVKDAGASFSTNCGTDPIVNIPDANFKAALVGNNSINTNGDGEIQVSEAEAFSDYMDVSNQGITDLTGIAAFKNLLVLTCSNNALTSLNLASNTALTWLDCNSNQLTNLDVSHNTQLNTLLCRFNQLTSLDVSNNSLLSTLGCSYNQIAALNVSQNLQLLTLGCSSNNIESLDCSNNTALSFFDCSNNKLSQLNVKNGNNANLTYFDAQLNASLTCIQVDDAAYMSANWNNWKDVTANYSTYCGTDPIVNIPDANFKAALVNNTAINTNGDGEIQVSEAQGYTGSIDVSNLGINDLTGIEAFTALTELQSWGGNNIGSLDLSANTLLRRINVPGNNIFSLVLPQTTSLIDLRCEQNQLSNINLSVCPGISVLYCGGNQIASLDLSSLPSLYALDCSNNSIGQLDLSGNALLFNLVCANNNLTDLNVSANTSLWFINCQANHISSLNVSTCPGLQYLYCNNNQIAGIDISHNQALTDFWCSENPISAINVSSNLLLSTLNCSATPITSLNLSSNTALQTLLCSSTNISNLNLSSNTALQWLECDNTSISSLDLSGNHDMYLIRCFSINNLVRLNIKNGNNTQLFALDLKNNPNLTCIQVDDPSYMNTNWGAAKDATANYSTNCGSCNVYNASLAIDAGSSSSICSGGSTNIAVNISGASATSSYFDLYYTNGNSGITGRFTATGPNVSIPINVTPSASTTYSLVSVTDEYGCTAIIQDTFTAVTVNPLLTFFRDADGDGYGDAATTIESCEQPAGYVTGNTDCNDNDNTIFPGAPELCDGKDNNCNGQTDEGCTANISINDVSVKEGNKGQKTLKFTVSLSTASAKTIRVNYATQDGTAVAPGDYVAQSGTLTFKPGKVTATVSILINGDRIAEPDETFSVLLTNPKNAGITKATGTGTILNDDKTNFAAASISNNLSTGTKAVVMPNPANSFVNVQITGFTGLVTISLMNVQGKTVLQQKQQTGNTFSNQLQLNVSNLTAGLYILVITDEKGDRITEKVVIQH